jgi:antitoxin HicB
MEYAARFEPATEGGFVITFPDFPWGITQGDSEAQAREMALDAICTMLQELIGKGEDLPRPSKPHGAKYRMIRLPALQAAKAELYRQFTESGIRKAGLARRLKVPAAIVDRLFDLDYSSKLEQLESAFQALGKELQIRISDAA